MARSMYDDLHDEFSSCSTTKSGTRYERLSAFVLKALRESDIVVHDIKLRDDAGVLRQIDVSIQDAHRLKRVLIECKDLEISGQKVGLDVVTQFYGVKQLVHPDEAIIITCNGFTKDAQQCAKHTGIKLVIVRDFKESDWRGLIKEIHLTTAIQAISQPKIEFLFSSDDDKDRFRDALHSIQASISCLWADRAVYLHFPDGRALLHEFVQGTVERHHRNDPGPVSLKFRFINTTLDVEDRASIPIQGMHINFEVDHYERLLKITSERIARLIVEGFGDSDLVICDDDLTRFTIDETTGEVIPVS